MTNIINPNPIVSSVIAKSSGLIIMKFNMQMIIPDNLSVLTEGIEPPL